MVHISDVSLEKKQKGGSQVQGQCGFCNESLSSKTSVEMKLNQITVYLCVWGGMVTWTCITVECLLICLFAICASCWVLWLLRSSSYFHTRLSLLLVSFGMSCVILDSHLSANMSFGSIFSLSITCIFHMESFLEQKILIHLILIKSTLSILYSIVVVDLILFFLAIISLLFPLVYTNKIYIQLISFKKETCWNFV